MMQLILDDDWYPALCNAPNLSYYGVMSRIVVSRSSKASLKIGNTAIWVLFCLGWLLLGIERFWLPPTTAPVWGSKPLLGYFALTASLSHPMQQGAGLSAAQVSLVQEIAHQETEALRQIELESRNIIDDPRLSLEEKRLGIAQMGFNPRVNQIVRESSLGLESALGTPVYRRLVRWIEQRWSIERYLHGASRPPMFIVGRGSSSTEWRSITHPSPAFQRTFKIFATHYDSKGAYYVALPDQCLKFTNGGMEICEGKGYKVGKEYSAYVSYKKKGAAARVGEAGPWNVDDNYWATLSDPTPRRMFADLALGMPEAQAAYFNGYNGGVDQYGRKVTGPYGIDLSRKVGDDIGLKWGVNDWVSISYLWTAEWGSGGSGQASEPGSAVQPGVTDTAVQTLASVQSVKLSTPDRVGRVVHQVAPGETLWSIAVAYKVTLQNLYTLNNLTEQSVIIPGQNLTIRLPGTGPTDTPVESPTATQTLRSTSTSRPTHTPPGVAATSAAQLSLSATQTQVASAQTGDGTASGRGLFTRFDPMLGTIALFMLSGIVLIVVGRLLGKKSNP
jgi:LysM repeat protein